MGFSTQILKQLKPLSSLMLQKITRSYNTMSNKEKRAKRTKLKAKQARVNKNIAKTFVNSSTKDVTRISDDFIELFKKLPEPSPSFEFVPSIRKYCEEIAPTNEFEDFEASVGLISTMYVHWKTSGSNVLLDSELQTVGDLILDNEEFKNQFNNLH